MNMTSLKHLILCADDFGQNMSICDGILQLAAEERINAISCLVNMPSWFDAAPDLLHLPDSCHIGLHLNLTFGQALSSVWRANVGDHFTGLAPLICKAYLRSLNKHALFAEIQTQLNAFIDTMGRYPDFIDGHQHIHQLPQVRDALFDLYAQEKLACYVRHTSNGWHDFLVRTNPVKVQAIAALGGRAFSAKLKKHNLQTHTSFAGVYAFKNSAHYRKYFKRFLSNSMSCGLIMCHPGKESRDLSDPLHKSRVHEFNYFKSDDFVTDLLEHSSTLMSGVPS
jgi:chitin disaccharide deacetylase